MGAARKVAVITARRKGSAALVKAYRDPITA